MTDKLNVDKKWAELDKLTYEWIHKNVDSTLGFINWTAGHKSLTDFVAQLLTKERERVIDGVVGLVDYFDFVEPCEPDCTKERHAYHQGQWDMAGRMNKALGLDPHPQPLDDIKKQLKGLEQ